MNLIYCTACNDLVRLFKYVNRECACGASWGRDINGITMEAGGSALAVMINDWGLEQAIHRRAYKSPGSAFNASLYPQDSFQVKKVERPA